MKGFTKLLKIRTEKNAKLMAIRRTYKKRLIYHYFFSLAQLLKLLQSLVTFLQTKLVEVYFVFKFEEIIHVYEKTSEKTNERTED